MELTGKTALVTGSGRGIGRAVALAFAHEDMDVAVNYQSNSTAAEAVVAEILAAGRRAIAVRADVAELDDVQRMAAQVERELGPVDVLVNNAGGCVDTEFLTADPEVLERTLAVHVIGPAHCTRAVLGGMIERGWGRVINISSVAGIRGVAANAEYCTAKAAVLGFTRSLAARYGREGIAVNCIAPGIIRTDFHREKPESYWETVRDQRVPMAREGQAEEVAQAAVFLAASTYVNGELIVVDGGLTMRIA